MSTEAMVLKVGGLLAHQSLRICFIISKPSSYHVTGPFFKAGRPWTTTLNVYMSTPDTECVRPANNAARLQARLPRGLYLTAGRVDIVFAPLLPYPPCVLYIYLLPLQSVRDE